MIVRSFLDSNVVVYTDDPEAHAKRDRAVGLVEAARQTGLGVISTQVMQEYFSAITRKLGTPAAAAREKVATLTRLAVVQIDPPLILAAIDLHRLHRLSIWDALIVQAATAAGCRELLSEDMQPGFRFGGVEVVNPFG
jgi:predicted nucleic acid-binding protein